jgi:hypothetical protein
MKNNELTIQRMMDLLRETVSYVESRTADQMQSTVAREIALEEYGSCDSDVVAYHILTDDLSLTDAELTELGYGYLICPSEP